jgi:chitinase
MRRTLAALLVAAGVAGTTTLAGAGAATGPAPVVAAYFADYEAPYSAEEIPAAHLTDVIYAFGAIGPGGRCTLANPHDDVVERFPGLAPPRGAPEGELGQLALLKQRYPQLATEISIGGGGSGSDRFSAAAATAAGRSALVRSCIDLFLRRWPGLFDGIDLDWEFPVSGGPPGVPARPSDRADATALLEQFRAQLDRLTAASHRRYLLTAALPAFRAADGSYTPATSWNLPALARTLDWVNLMTYDLVDAAAHVTGFESALRLPAGDPAPQAPGGGDTIEGAVSYYESHGVPASKIVIGAPFYGISFNHVAARRDGLFQRFGRLGVAIPYAQIASGLPGYRRYWSATAAEPWLYDARTHTLISYDDPAAMAAKARYVLAAHLRGAMIWEISMDDPSNSLLDALSAPLVAPRR